MEESDHYFKSQLAGNVFGADTTFNAAQFHFHSKSEHTIDGVQFDLEMHTVHLPPETKRGFFAGVMGVIFDVSKYTAELTDDEEAIIDNFFASLDWDNVNSEPTVDMTHFAELMNLIDTSNRWIYKGTLTTPPCTGNVYWNVVRKVYPIKQAQRLPWTSSTSSSTGAKVENSIPMATTERSRPSTSRIFSTSRVRRKPPAPTTTPTPRELTHLPGPLSLLSLPLSLSASEITLPKGSNSYLSQ